MKYLLFLLFSALYLTPLAQTSVLEQGRKHAQALASPDMKGRGYQEDGHFIAARYIADRFAEYGLQPLPGVGSDDYPYFQTFSFATNLVSDLSLTLEKEQMEEGRQFIASSVTGRGEIDLAKVVDVGHGLPTDYKKKKSVKGKMVVMRDGLPEKVAGSETLKEKYKDFRYLDRKLALAHQLGVEGVIVLKKKLTAGFRPMPVDFPVVEVLIDELPKKNKVKKAAMNVQAQLKRIQTQNVVGMIKGKTHPDSAIVLCGHYDHLGMQGNAIFYGGNDNASGTSLLITLAEHFSKPENQPDYSLVFIAFGAEEAGLHGSRYYVKDAPAFPLEQTSFVLNMDLMANGDEGITAVAGAQFPAHRDLLRQTNDRLEAVPKVKSQGNRRNSDHYYFTEAGVPAIFIFTLGGPPHYHDIYDNYENMQFSKFAEIHELFVEYVEALMDPNVTAK